MKLFKSQNWLRLLALAMVFCLAMGCLAGCSGDTGSDDDDDGKGNSGGDLVKYEWDGLIYYLDEDFGKPTTSAGNYAMHTDGDLTLIVAGAAAENGITDSSSAAQAYVSNVQSACKSIEIKNKDGVYYTVMKLDDGTTETRGFYVYNGYAWNYYIITYDYDEYSQEMISYVTSAEINKDYQHGDNSSNTGNSDNSGNSGNSGNSSNSGSNGNSGSSGNSSTVGLTKHEWDGLTYYLRDSYSTTDGGDYVMHVSGDTSVMIVSGELKDGINDAYSFAQLYVSDMASNGYKAQLASANGVYYTVSDWGDGTTEVRGFYVYNGYGWCIYGTTYDYDVDGANLITYATSGEIDENYQHHTSGGTSGSTSSHSSTGSDSTDSGSSGNGNVTPNPNAPTVSNEVTVYTYVPTSWGTPKCWAWSNATQKTAYDAWPGETMLWIGKYYATSIPDWVDRVIISSNDSNLMTYDIAIESGKNVWIIVYGEDHNYSVLYSYPTNQYLASMGY